MSLRQGLGAGSAGGLTLAAGAQSPGGDTAWDKAGSAGCHWFPRLSDFHSGSLLLP